MHKMLTWSFRSRMYHFRWNDERPSILFSRSSRRHCCSWMTMFPECRWTAKISSVIDTLTTIYCMCDSEYILNSTLQYHYNLIDILWSLLCSHSPSAAFSVKYVLEKATLPVVPDNLYNILNAQFSSII